MDITTLTAYFSYHPETFWLAMAAALLMLEVLLLPGIGLLFGGLGALTLGGLMAFGVLNADAIITQSAYFFLFTSLWALALWVPLRRWGNKHGSDHYNNIIGTRVTVLDAGLQPGKEGKVKWSGTVMTALLAEGEPAATAGDSLTVYSLAGSVLVLKR